MLVKNTGDQLLRRIFLDFLLHKLVAQDLLKGLLIKVAFEHALNSNGNRSRFLGNDDDQHIRLLACADTGTVAHAEILAQIVIAREREHAARRSLIF